MADVMRYNRDDILCNHLQKEKAEKLLALHFGEKALILPNIWSPIGARILEKKGFSAVATASAAISASLGYKDGEKIQFSTLLDIATRIAESVDIPTTVDIETGYSNTHEELRHVITSILNAGIVGVNIEDSFNCGLRSINEQAERIAIIREVSREFGIHLVINARIDCFISDAESSQTDKYLDCIERANAYLEAGADCVFPLGINDLEVLRNVRLAISGPINALVLPEQMTIPQMQEIGINRFSFGPFIFRSLLNHFSEIVDEISESGSSDRLNGNMFSYGQTQQYLRDNSEK